MNRQQRRAFERRLQANALRHPVPASVTLQGGPMDGWVVKPDAPALRPDWWTTWPASIAERHAPGRYADPVPAGLVVRSSWQPHA